MKFLILACAALACASAEYTGPQHVPVINALGVPVDTAEVQHAKALHFAAKAQTYTHDGQYYPHFYNGQYPYFYNSPYHYDYAPYAHVNKDVPAETPEVVAAKISHFAAHAEALSRHRRGIYAPVAYSGPVVAHTPVVAHAPVVAHTPFVAQTYSAFPYVHSATYTHKF